MSISKTNIRQSLAIERVHTLPSLLELVTKWRKAGETVVFTNGVFDILHCGHLLSFEFAAQQGDHLIVGVNTDQSARTLDKGKGRPFNKDTDRAKLIAGLRVVDAVILFDQPTPLELIVAIQPDVLVKGMDYELDAVVGREYAGRVERVPLLEGYSTTNLIEKIYDSLKTV